MPRLTFKEIDKVVRVVAHKYARLCWWASLDELVQSGWVAVLTALPSFDPAVGVPVQAFLYRVCTFAMRRELWRESSPVSGGWHRPEVQRTSQRAPLSEAMEDVNLSPEEAFAARAWDAKVRDRLLNLVGPVSTSVLLGIVSSSDQTCRESRGGVDSNESYRATSTARRRVAEDQELWLLMEDRKGW